jgi:hypothetical protein
MGALLQGVKEIPCDLVCGHPDADDADELEMTISINDGPEIPISEWAKLAEAVGELEDPLIAAAAQLVVATDLGAVSMLQRRLRISFHRAQRIMGELEAHGVVGPHRELGAREVLMNVEQLDLYGFRMPAPVEAADEGESDEKSKKGTSALTNAGELTLKVADSELVLPLYDEGVFPTWERILEHDVGDIDGGTFGAHVMKRLGSLRLPTGEDPILDWTFCGPDRPVLFKVSNHDPDLEMHGAFMPMRSS